MNRPDDTMSNESFSTQTQKSARYGDATRSNTRTPWVTTNASSFPKLPVISRSSMTPLPPNYIPGPNDVICARGKAVKSHSGNQQFREKVQNFIGKYSDAATKFEKSLIVSQVVESVGEASPNGGLFIKYLSGQWYQVSDNLAREKVGQAFRDALHSKYKSSSKAKRRRWRMEEVQKQKLQQDEQQRQNKESSYNQDSASTKSTEIIDHIVQSHPGVQRITSQMAEVRIHLGGVNADDALLSAVFDRVNHQLLSLITSDGEIQSILNS